MNVQSGPKDKVEPRRRKGPPRRVPAVIEQRERKPFIFGWGAHLTNREREALKEKIALFGGIGLAVALLLIVGWGWYQDNVAGPAARDAANNVPIAQVGTYTIKTGYFKGFEQFRQAQLNLELNSVQQQISSLGTSKKNSSQVAQLQGIQSQIQAQLNSVSTNSLTTLLDDQTVLQRSSTAGVSATPKQLSDAEKQFEGQFGGKYQLLQLLAPTGFAYNDLGTIVKAEYLGAQIQKKLGGRVPKVQVKVRASHILIPANQKPLAEKLYREVLHGANFATLAHKYSKDPGSAQKGGDLGYFTHGAMVAPFDAAAFSMKVGQVRLVQSKFGWHIIKVTGRQKTALSATEYSQAQQNAFNGWMVKQQSIIGVRRYLRPDQLPGIPTPTPAAGITSQNSLPSQIQQVPSTSVPVPAPQSKTGTSSKTHPKSSSSTKR